MSKRPLEVGDEDFDFGVRAGFADGFDAVGEVLGAAVAQVVAVNRGDDDVTQVHGFDGFCKVFRLVGVEHIRTAVSHVAERAAAGADVAHNHEGRRAFAEAFADVGAGGFLANGVHLLFAQNVFDFKEFARWEFGAYPFGLFQFFLKGDDFDGDAGGFVRASEFDAAFGVVGFDFTHCCLLSV